MKVYIIATGEVKDLDPSYAVRLIEQRKAVLAEDVPVTPEGKAVNVYELERTADVLNDTAEALLKVPGIVQMIVESGQAASIYHVGDEIVIPYTDRNPTTPVTYQWPFVVAAIADCEDDNGVTHHNALWMVAKKASPMGMIFCAKSGRIDWSKSDMREWLNSTAGKSDGTTGTWWTEKVADDPAPDAYYRKRPGFMNGFDSAWQDVFKPVKVLTHTDAAGETFDTTYDKFFLPSAFQVAGEIADIEDYEDAWDYFTIGVNPELDKNDAGYSPNRVDILQLGFDTTDDRAEILLRTAKYDDPNWWLNNIPVNGRIAANKGVTGGGIVIPAFVIY